MPEIATFFRNRRNDDGETYDFSVTSDRRGEHELFVYARKRLEEEEWPSRRQFGDLNAAWNAISKAVQRAGGGVIVTSSVNGSSRTIEVRNVGDCGAPAQRFLILRPGFPAHSEASGRKHTIQQGSHVIVPVDEEADKHLEAFRQDLTWLPPDYEELVFDAIRRPSLDTRLANVEKTLFGSLKTAARSVFDPAVRTLAIAGLLFVLILANAFELYQVEKLWHSWPQPVQPVQQSSARPTAPPQPQHPDGGGLRKTTSIGHDVKGLLSAVHKKRTKIPGLKGLYDANFKDFDNDTTTDEAIDRVFQTPQTEQERALLIGIIKLPATLDPALEKDGTARTMIANIACRAGWTPELVTAGGEKSPCDALGTDDIQKGISLLVDRLRKS